MLDKQKKKILQHQSAMILNRHSEGTPFNKTDAMRLVYSEVMLMAYKKDRDNVTPDDINQMFRLDDLIQMLTPREFSKIFPITKSFKVDGEFKDYFSVSKDMADRGWDKQIDNGFSFLMDYFNIGVQMCAVTAMMTISHATPGPNLIERFFNGEGEVD